MCIQTTLKVSSMPSSWCPTQDELNGIFEGSLSHNVLSCFACLFSVSLFFLTLHVFIHYIKVSGFVFLWYFCLDECLSAYFCVPYVFSLALFLPSGCLFCLICFIFVFLLSLTVVCVIIREKKNGYEFAWKKR